MIWAGGAPETIFDRTVALFFKALTDVSSLPPRSSFTLLLSRVEASVHYQVKAIGKRSDCVDSSVKIAFVRCEGRVSQGNAANDLPDG